MDISVIWSHMVDNSVGDPNTMCELPLTEQMVIGCMKTLAEHEPERQVSKYQFSMFPAVLPWF